jgi:hypothetical protein
MPTEIELDQMSGFNRVQITFFPSIKFGSTKMGQTPVKEFSLLSTNDKGELVVVSLGEEVKCVLLHRGKMKLKSSDCYTTEYEKKSDIVSVYNKEKNFKVATGTAEQMKEKYQMRTVQSPYVMIDVAEQVVIAKLTVIPSSLSNYWDFLNEFKGDEKPRMFETIVKADKKESKGKGGAYFKMCFERGSKLPEEAYELAVSELVELNKKMKDNDEARGNIKDTDVAPVEDNSLIDTDPEETEEDKQEKNAAGLG